MANKINKISDITIQKIKQKSVLFVPDRPGEKGMTAAQLKQAFVGLVTDSNNSTIAEVNRITDEINLILAGGFIGIYETLPNTLDFELGDTIILTDGSIYKLNESGWEQLSLSKQDVLDIEQRLDDLINLNATNISNVQNQANTNTDNITDLNTDLQTTKDRVSVNETNIAKKLDKETLAKQTIKGPIKFEKPIESEGIDFEGSSMYFSSGKGIVFTNKVWEDMVGIPNDTELKRLAPVEYVLQKTNETKSEILGGATQEQLDTIKELAEALNNDPNVVNNVLQELGDLKSNKVDKTTKINGYDLTQDIVLSKVDIGLANVDNTSDLDKPISNATQLALDQKANNADLAPVLNLVNLGLFTTWGTNNKSTNSIGLVGDISSQLQIRDYNFPLSVGIQHTYTVDDITYALTLTDSPILDFMGEVIYYGDGKGKITIWKSSISATSRTNTETYVKYIRNNDESNWERIAYTSDLEELETVINNELATMDTKIETNKNTIDKIISGEQIVGRAMLATNLTSDTRIEVVDTFGARITATNNNEIVSAIGDEGTAEIASIGGFSVKQVLKDSEAEVLTTETPIKYIEGKPSEVADGVIVNSKPQQIISKSNDLVNEHTISLPALPLDYGMPKLPNEIGDRYYPDGKYVKNVGKVVFSGSENWTYSNEPINSEIVFSFNQFNVGTNLSSLDGNILGGGINYERIAVSGSYIYIRVYKNDIPNYQDSWTTTEKVNAFKEWLSQNTLEIYYQLATPETITTATYNSTIPTYTNGSITLDGKITLDHLYKYDCQANNEYFVSCSITNKTNLKITNGTTDYLMTSGFAKFQPTTAGEYWISYVQDGVNKVSKAQWFDITAMGLTTKTADELHQLLGYKFYPYGITNTKPKTFKSIGENLWDYKYFYDTLKAVNADNISYVEKDGRECIKITNPSVYHNKGIELYKGKFSANVRYKVRVEMINTLAGIILEFVYTDGSKTYATEPNATTTWKTYEFTSTADKTISYIGITFADSADITHFNTSKFQLQMLDNPEDQFLPYTENTIQIPQVYQPYGMPSLPNGVRDRIVRVGEKWYFNQEVGKIIIDGELNTFNWSYHTIENNILSFYSGIFNSGKSRLNDYVASNYFSRYSIGLSEFKDLRIIFGKGNIGFYLLLNIDRLKPYGFIEGQTATYNNAINSWFKDNTTEIYYSLATPILTPIPTWLAQYLAYNYGREEILDISGNPVPTSTIIKYYLDNKKQIETNTTNIADLLVRVQALENK